MPEEVHAEYREQSPHGKGCRALQQLAQGSGGATIPGSARMRPLGTCLGGGPCSAGVSAGPGHPGGVSRPKPRHSPAFPGPSRSQGRRRPRSSRFPLGGRGHGVIGARPQRRSPSLPPVGIMSPPLFSLPEARLRFTVSLPRLPRLPPALPPSFQPSLRPCRSDGKLRGRAVPRRLRARGRAGAVAESGPGAALWSAERGRDAAGWE